MITYLLLKFIKWWDYDFPILARTVEGYWVGVADFKSGHKLFQDDHFPSMKTAKVYQGDYITLMTALDNCVTGKTHPEEEKK